MVWFVFFFFSSRRRHTRFDCDWSSDVCSSDLVWLNNVSTQFVVNPSTGQLEPQNVLTTNNQSRVTKAFGVPDLAEETSINWSGGLTFRAVRKLSLTAAAFCITIDGQSALRHPFASNESDPAF